MNTKHYVPFIAVGLIILAFFSGRGCKGEVSIPVKRINTDSIAKSSYDQGYKVAEKKIKATIQHDTVYKKLGNWDAFKAKTDTIRDTIFREAVYTCDEALQAQGGYIGMLQDICADQDTLIATWRSAYRGDSTNFAGYRDSVSRVPSKFWKGFKVGFITGNITGASASSALLR